MCNIVGVFPSTEHKMQEVEASLTLNIFPQKLWQLVHNSEITGIIWNEQGDGIIVNKNVLEKEFLCFNCFKSSSFPSFTRQLNMYGFRKSQRHNREKLGIHHYSHINFKRYQPELLPMVRRCLKKSKPTTKDDPQKERWRDHRNIAETDETHLHNSEAFSVDFW